MSLFPQPSKIVERLRNAQTYFKTQITGFPAFDVYGAASQDLAEIDSWQEMKGTNPTPVLYVMNGSSSGEIDAMVETVPTTVTSGYFIVLVLRMEDHRGQQADEWTTFFRDFCIRALHGWDPFGSTTVPGQDDPATPSAYPLTFASDTPVNVPGFAYIRRTFEFNHVVYVDRSCLDLALGSWDDLDWFEELRATLEATAPTGGDTIELPVDVNITIT